MKVTFSMILERTAQLLGTQPIAVSLHFEGPVRAVSSLNDDYPLNEDTLYVCESLPPPAMRPRQMLCLSGQTCSSTDSNLALFPKDVACSKLLSLAQAALRHYIHWGDHILELIYTGQGLDAIVSFAYDAFQNPILIYDSSLKVLAYTRNDGSTDRMWRDTVRGGTVNSMSAEEARELLLYINKLNNSPKPFKHSAKDLTDPFYNGNILLDGRRVGMVDLMERHHTITQGELDLLEAFCYLLSFELQKDVIRRESRGLVYHQLIVDLLDGSIRDASALLARLTATRWSASPYARVICFQPVNDFMTSVELQQAFDRLLALSLGRCILREREIILILSCEDVQLAAGTTQILRSYCSAHQLRCGISDAYENLLDTSIFAPQASMALSLSGEQLVAFSDVRFKNLLRLCRSQRCPAEYLHPSVTQLVKHDQLHGTDYAATLDALFSCQFNQMLAARVLHIHRTTLIYRLQRISEMTGLDLSDAQDMLHVHLSLRILQSAEREKAVTPAGAPD